MGGQETTRGILVQSLTTLLDALDNPSWSIFTIEPTLKSEKVDILWDREDGTKKVTQVKSSKNQIGLPDAKRWAEELHSSISADEYQLTLVGFVSKGIVGQQKVDGVSISIQQLDLVAFIEQCAHRLDRYLNQHEIRLTAMQRELLVKVLLAELLLLSVSGAPLTSEEFKKILLDSAQVVKKSSTIDQEILTSGCDITIVQKSVPTWGVTRGWSKGLPSGGTFLRFPVFISNNGTRPGTITEFRCLSVEKVTDLIQIRGNKLLWRLDSEPISSGQVDVQPNEWISNIEAILGFDITEPNIERVAARIEEFLTPYILKCEVIYQCPIGTYRLPYVIQGSFSPIFNDLLSNWEMFPGFSEYAALARGALDNVSSQNLDKQDAHNPTLLLP